MAKEATEYQKGQVVDLVLDSDVNVGDVIPLKTMVAVAVVSGLTGETIAAETEKVWQVNAATADAVEVGDVLYFDATNRVVTTVDTSNTLAGKAMSAKAAAVAGFVHIKINA